MNQAYDDIRDRIDAPPLWFDEAAVPRYAPFHPQRLSCIYGREAALVEIACQSCGHRFHVAFCRSRMDDVQDHQKGRERRTLSQSILEKTIHYGDPPNVDCCPAGPTMNSDPLRVIEYWLRDDTTSHEWARVKDFEVSVADVD